MSFKPLTKEFLLKRGSCCNNNCINCPYKFKKEMKVAICLIIKDENEYLEEWLTHHRNIGFKYFIIYDNCSKYPVKHYLDNELNLLEDNTIFVNIWKDDLHASQLRAYKHCCENYKEFDYILFIDTDEFLYLKGYNTIQEYINSLPIFDALGIYWRMYGGNYTNNRIPEKEYTKYYKNEHIKSIVNPKKVIDFKDPHKATLELGSKYIDELSNDIISPLGIHTSETIWIKHIWTRSLKEWNEKLKRGSGDKVVRNYTEKDFINHNEKCTINE